ncbi:MAG: hypothetical protein M1816_001458 [Peltula sp. TS41687]|nr:MAG: hypothetical protein M1816_001458 [Peltula sp. TS41687]
MTMNVKDIRQALGWSSKKYDQKWTRLRGYVLSLLANRKVWQIDGEESQQHFENVEDYLRRDGVEPTEDVVKQLFTQLSKHLKTGEDASAATASSEGGNVGDVASSSPGTRQFYDPVKSTEG